MNVRDSQTRVRGIPMDPYGYANVRPGNHTLSGSTLRVLSHHARGESSKRPAGSSQDDERQERQLAGPSRRFQVLDGADSRFRRSYPGFSCGFLRVEPTWSRPFGDPPHVSEI